MEDLIIHAHMLYDEHSSHNSPPLPPTPAGEPVPVLTYGSKSTIVANMPLTPISSAVASQVTSSPQDFTPRLPSRPTGSIHPSLRANPQTPTRGRPDAPWPGIPTTDESPPPSPSVTSTIYETDDSGSPVEEHAPAVTLRPTSPLQIPTTSETSDLGVPSNSNTSGAFVA